MIEHLTPKEQAYLEAVQDKTEYAVTDPCAVLRDADEVIVDVSL
jgi:hypothetical protein